MHKNVKKTIPSTLDEFFSELRSSCGNPSSDAFKCSEQAFSKARSGINHILFKECFDRILDFLCTQKSHEFHKRLNHRWGLITNDFGTDKHEFPYIYSLRWPVEETYKLIKEKVGLTNFCGYTPNSILQEVWISVLLANLSLAIKRETDAIIDETINKGDNKHKYQTNMNELNGVISRNIDKYMMSDSTTLLSC